MAIDKKLHSELPPLGELSIDHAPSEIYEQSVERALEWAKLRGLAVKPPDLDPFTGWRLDFDPEDVRHWGGRPPALPGADPDHYLHPARGRKDGPLYVSPNILPSDPAWIKLAYMRYPLDRPSLAALLKDMVPESLFRAARSITDEGAERRSYDGSLWNSEMMALQRMNSDSGHAFNDGDVTEEEIARYFSRVLHITAAGDSKTLIDLWRGFQRLAVSVLWAWGTRHEPLLNILFCCYLADDVGWIWQQSHPRFAAINTCYVMTEAVPRTRRAEIEEDKEEFAQRQKARTPNNSFWQQREYIPSVARIVDGLSLVIGSAGYYLDMCPNCGRLFFRPDDRKLFCSPNCRTTFNRKRPAGEATASARKAALSARRRDEASER